MAETLPGLYRFALGVLIFTAFLTQAKFIPSIRNNVGPFEVAGLLMIAVFFLSPHTLRPLAFNATTRAALGILVISLVSQLNIPETRRLAGLIAVAIQVFFALFLIVLYNLLRQHRVGPQTILRWVTLALLVVGPWIIIVGLGSQEMIQEVGPFRNRAHMASYMLTAFWMALVYSQWPGLRTRSRLIAYSCVAMTLYAVAVAGRRSVYLSLIVGLAALGATFLVATRQKRWRLVVAGVFVVGIIYAMYQYGPRFLPQLEFFQTRVGMIDERLGDALAVSAEAAEEGSFFALQREGIRHAFTTHPLLGIGWGGFAKSHYSPTGHEVHSTPLRFLAETGLAGFLLYLTLMISLLRSAWLAFLWMRGTPYGNAYLVLALGFTSLLLSYAYNRHVTERTFWLLIAVIFAAELFAHRYHALARETMATPAEGAPEIASDPSPSRQLGATPAISEPWAPLTW